MIDKCLNCPAKRYKEDGNCPLPYCLRYGPNNTLSASEITIAVLWEKGLTIEDILAQGIVNTRNQVVALVSRWRERKRALGLLI